MNSDLWLVAISLFTWGAGEGMFIYFQPLYLQKWGADPLQIGGILGVAGIAMAVAQAPAGYLADRYGNRPVMWLAWVLGLAAAGLMALANSLGVFVAGLLLYSLTAFVTPPMSSYITRIRGRLSVERALTFVNAIYHFGAVLGPLAGGMLGERLGLKSVYAISAGIFIVSTLVIFFIRQPAAMEAGKGASEGREHPDLLKNPRFGAFFILVSLTMFALFLPQPLTPVYLQNVHGISLSQMGALGSAGSLGNAVIMLLLGQLNAPLGLAVGQASVALFTLFIWRGDQMAWFFLGYFFFGGYRLCRSMALAYARRLVTAAQTGFAYGLIETGNSLAVIAAPLAAGLLYTQSPDALYLTSLVILASTFVANLLLIYRTQPVSA